MIAFGCVACLAGCVLIFLSMRRHHQDWIGTPPEEIAQYSLRSGGFTLLTFGLLLGVDELGWAYSLVLWLGELSSTAALVVLIDVNRERVRRWRRWTP